MPLRARLDRRASIEQHVDRRDPRHPEVKRSLAMASAASSGKGDDGVPVLFGLAAGLSRYSSRVPLEAKEANY
jgi:hypothetical protein